MSNYRDRQNENQPEQPQVQPQPVYAQQTSANDTNSKLLPILTLVLAFFLPFASIVLGHISLSQMKTGIMSSENRALALAGLILGYVFTALTLLVVIGYFALMAAWTSYGY